MNQISSTQSQNLNLEKLQWEIDQTKDQIRELGYPLKQKPSFKTLAKMKCLSETQIDHLCFQLRVNRYLAQAPEAQMSESGAGSQRALFQKALDFFGLEPSCSEVPDFTDDDIIEIYNPQATQLYRSLNFFKYSGYSLEDLLLNEWFVLWERPSWVIDQWMKESASILSGDEKMLETKVGPHILREILQDEEAQTSERLIEHKVKYLLALQKKGTGRIGGMVCVSEAVLLEQNRQASNLSFL